MRRALVTGAAGFAGSHLVQMLLTEGLEVVAAVRDRSQAESLLPSAGGAEVTVAELLSPQEARKLVAAARAELVFHLAGQPFVPLSWEDPAGTFADNVLAQLNLLQGIVAEGIAPRVLVVGSNEEYGLIRPDELPVRETNPLRPANPYAVSKVAQDMMGYQYFLSHGLPCVRVRPFNHIGPRQREQFVAAVFAKQVAEAESGLREPVIRVGNLQAVRDFTDVRDVARGYYFALTRGQPGEVYNVGSGRGVTIQSLLDHFLSRSRVHLEVAQDSLLFRASDVPASVCDFSKLEQATGWQPQIPLEKTLDDVLDYWRRRVGQGAGLRKGSN